MAASLKALDETTIDSVRKVVEERFSPETFRLLRKLLTNPLRRPTEDIGMVVCDGPSVAGVTASIVRRLYFGKEPFVGINGGVLAMGREASPALLFPLLKKAHFPRFGSVLFYSNTCSPATVKMKPCFGVRNAGPDTWGRIRYARLRRLPLVHPFLSPRACAAAQRCFSRNRAAGLRVSAHPDFTWADDLFGRYVEGNDGIVSSRTTDELTWAFGDVILSGQGLVLVAQRGSTVVGYVVVQACAYDPGRWLIGDALALNNDRKVLALLFKAARRAVCRCSRARALSVIGFPSWLNETLAIAFPRSCATVCNGFVWGFSDKAMEARCEASLKAEKGWFFGPYDGDYSFCRM